MVEVFSPLRELVARKRGSEANGSPLLADATLLH
jgi:hypothetical protein